MKRIIQFCSMLVLVAAFYAVSANAQSQTTNRIDAKIPFSFNVGDRSYEAGEYVIKLSRSGVTLEDEKGNQLQSMLVSSIGEVSNGDARLVFDPQTNGHQLAKILIAGKGFLLQSAEAKKEPVKIASIRQ